MIQLPVNHRIWAAAKARRAELDAIAATLPGGTGSVADAHKRTRGHAAELAFVEFLQANNHDPILNGGIDDLPDVEIDGVGVGVKYCGRTYAPQHTVEVFADQMTVPTWAFLGAPPNVDDHVLLLGFATHEQLAAGQLELAGVPTWRGYTPKRDARTLRVHELEPFATWQFRVVTYTTRKG